MPQQTVRVLFSCTGVGIFNRGIESFFREAFDGLKDKPGIDAWLLKGAGPADEREIPVWCLPRTGTLARWLGRMIQRNSYIAEQLSSFLSVARQIRRLRPQVVFYSDANLGFQLYPHRKWIGVPYRLLFSNGGPVEAPFARTDFVHQVAPFYFDEALRAGEPRGKHFMVPYGIRVNGQPAFNPAGRQELRRKMGLPLDRQIVLTVGRIAREHKRMHYVIEELAKLPQPRPFLQMLGAMDEATPEIIQLANRYLGPEGFAATSVSYEQVGESYRAADVFVLASLREGFGRVYLEAMSHGLPVIAHRHPVMEYVLGNEGVLGNLNEPGALMDLLRQQLSIPHCEQVAVRRWQSVRDTFSWPVLALKYHKMFKDAAGAECLPR